MRNIAAIVIILCMASAMSGQIGLRGGINYSNVSIEGLTNIETNSKIGFHAGIQGNIPLDKILMLRPALLYHIKGSRVTTNGDEMSRGLHYMEVPLNLGFKLGGGPISLILEGGPYLGYLVNTSDGLFNDISKSDWGANFGVILEIRKTGFGINYSNGLNNIEKQDQLNEAFKLRNGNLAAFIYFNF